MDSKLIDVLKTHLKFTDNQIEQINSNKDFYLYRNHPNLMYNLLINYSFLLEKKLTTISDEDKALSITIDDAKESVKNAITHNPLIMYYSSQELEKKWDNLTKVVIPDNENLNNPFVLSSKMVTDLVLAEANILNTDYIKINIQLERIAKFGYTKKQLINIVKNNPTTLVTPIDDLKKRFYSMTEYKYSKNDVLRFTSRIPDLLTYPDERVENRFLILNAIGLHDAPIKSPYILRFSSHTTYARYCYFIDNNIEINMENYNDLFACEKDFSKKYGVSSNRLTKIYKFKQFEHEKEKIFINREKKS